MEGSLNDLAKYRFECCKEALIDAKLMFENGRFKNTLNRGTSVRVSVKHHGQEHFIHVMPNRQTFFKEALWEEAAVCIKEVNRRMTEQRLAAKREKFFTWISSKEYKKKRED